MLMVDPHLPAAGLEPADPELDEYRRLEDVDPRSLDASPQRRNRQKAMDAAMIAAVVALGLLLLAW